GANGIARVELDAAPHVRNCFGTIHGGALASLVDYAGSMAVGSADVEGRVGVAVDLHVSYLAPATSSVVAEATVSKIGRSLAFVTVRVVDHGSGAVVCEGRMTKFLGRPAPVQGRTGRRARGFTHRRQRAMSGCVPN